VRTSAILPIVAPIFALGALVPATACQQLECAEGTHEKSGACVASLSPRCGDGTELRAGACVPVGGGGAECGPGTHSEGGACVPDLQITANAARLIEVDILEPRILGQVATGPLNGALDSGDALVYVAVYEPFPAATRVWGGGGTRASDGSYILDGDQAFDAKATRSGTQLSSEPFAMYFPALGSDALRLERVAITNLHVEVLERGLIPLAGTMTGVITPQNASKVFIELANATMDETLLALGVEPDVDYDGDGTLESWTLQYEFFSEPIWLF
jgi:hypothetical protein